jgi:hypothetical protein
LWGSPFTEESLEHPADDAAAANWAADHEVDSGVVIDALAIELAELGLCVPARDVLRLRAISRALPTCVNSLRPYGPEYGQRLADGLSTAGDGQRLRRCVAAGRQFMIDETTHGAGQQVLVYVQGAVSFQRQIPPGQTWATDEGSEGSWCKTPGAEH